MARYIPKNLWQIVDREFLFKTLYEQGGNILKTARICQCTPVAIYNHVDLDDELKYHIDKSREKLATVELETAYDAINMLIDQVENDPSGALRAATLVVSRAKASRYLADRKEEERHPGADSVIDYFQKAELKDTSGAKPEANS